MERIQGYRNALQREQAKLARQKEAVEATEATIELLERTIAAAGPKK